tara:strand:- start:766 stop:1065 length:300 start_codon:yes stop_codon:yes gene_type:complete
MLRKIFILTILILIISTTYIKNHTKKLDEEIFLIKENIDYLNNVKDLVQLENDYLSSPEKLLQLRKLYFEDDLSYTVRENIKIITNINEINLKNLNQND